ncbi:MAG TPA: SIMPL domain-containing protein [Candidatus Paceibacterota bacterium]|nr:SIMPL domain-containing protein [Candidatus Paceibacterota bacterium]
MLKLAAVTVISLIAFTTFAEPEIKGTPAELAQYLRAVPKTAVLSGEAEVRVPAHRAVVSLKVVTENKSLLEAMRQNRELGGQVAERLKKQGVPADRIQASKFASTPKFGVFGEKAKSYRVENVIRVTVQDEKEFQSAAAAVDQWSEVQFVGVEFEYADKETLKEKATEQACDKALQRKKLYEEKFGVQLTAVSFTQGNVMQNDAANFGAYSRKAYGISVTAGVPLPDSSDALVREQESFSSFGELIYNARVTVEFSVVPK